MTTRTAAAADTPAAPQTPLLAGLADLLARTRRTAGTRSSGWLAAASADRDGQRLSADLRWAASRAA